jgi:2-octaprenyl-6-methoxyphenol hydroxylase
MVTLLSNQPPDASAGCVDVLIAGGGIVGFALATAIKAALGPACRVEIWDPVLGRRSPRQRVSALSASSRRMLERLGSWSSVASRARAVTSMEITDSRLEDAVRPLLLTFEAAPAADASVAHIVFNADLEESLEGRARELGVGLRKQAVGDVRRLRDVLMVRSESGRAESRARLLVAADGARSPLREVMGVSTFGWDYHAEAAVLAVEHERDHMGCARQHFLPEGPFAALPLPGRRSSIVWSAPKATWERLAALPPDRFAQELTVRFGRELGSVAIVEAPMRFELRFQLARRFTAPRFALAGDAAHVVHPLAGQGLNLGLRDAAALAEMIVGQARLGLDPGAADALESYARARRFDTVAMAAAHEGLHRLFAAEGLARPARDWGLGVVQNSDALKQRLMREAAGGELLEDESRPTVGHPKRSRSGCSEIASD